MPMHFSNDVDIRRIVVEQIQLVLPLVCLSELAEGVGEGTAVDGGSVERDVFGHRIT